MAKNANRPAWFKMFLHQKALIDSVPDATAGKALKAAFRYFDTQEMEDLDPLAFAVFSVIKPYIDEAFTDYQDTCERNKQNIQKRWTKQSIPLDTTRTTGNQSLPLDTTRTTGNQSLPLDTEAEAETETETETETDAEESCRCLSAGAEKKFFPPSVEEIRKYCDNNNYTFDPVYFESYYRARGWRLGSVPMEDWKAVADAWQQKERNSAPKKNTPFPDVPTL